MEKQAKKVKARIKLNGKVYDIEIDQERALQIKRLQELIKEGRIRKSNHKKIQ